MTNEKYLEKCKITRSTYFDSVNKSIESGNSVGYEEMKLEVKKAHALEIIAETLINIDVGIANIEMQLNRR